MDEFLQAMGQCLETEVNGQTEFQAVDGWCSLMAFSMLITIERQFGRALAIGELLSVKTLDELYQKLVP